MRLLVLVPAVAIASPLAACPLYSDAVDAVQSGDVSRASALYETIEVDAECGDPIREWVGDYLARVTFLAAMEPHVTPADRRKGLERALRYETHWRSLAELGRLAWSEGAYSDAAAHLQLALNELAEGDPGHVAEREEIAEVYELATAALALADQAVELPRTRSGTPGGIFQTSIRGFEVEEVQLPITFEYNSVEFDAKGETYAMALAETLKSGNFETIELAGHTDPRGGEDFNMDLSLRRAESLRSFLESVGVSGMIVTKGYGESQLPTPPAGVAVGSEEHFRIARRVAFRTE